MPGRLRNKPVPAKGSSPSLGEYAGLSAFPVVGRNGPAPAGASLKQGDPDET